MLIDCDVLSLLLEKHRAANERRLRLSPESEEYELAVEELDRIERVIVKVARQAEELAATR